MRTPLKTSIISFLALISLAVISAQASDATSFKEKAKQLRLSEDSTWHRLLHFRKNIIFLSRSGIDDSEFFISPHGASDPQAELDATLDSFFSADPTSGDSTLCGFPARREWLNEKLNFPEVMRSPRCDRYENWKLKLAPQGISLIFASYYFNNPASMYGHTFLKLSRRGYENGQGLLDYTVNYAAEANVNNGATFAFKGLTGGYKGRFSTDPYYVKIQKYNNIESRDLWEYEINFSSAEINRLVQHLWELGPMSITYYFFNKNCSYELLPLLEVARPSLDLSSRFRYRTVPLDTLMETLSQKDLVGKWKLRPSHVRLMLARRSLLEPAEIKLAQDMASDLASDKLNRLDSLPVERQALVLDSSYDLLRYRAGFYRDRPVEFQEKEQKLLLLRKDKPAAKPANFDFDSKVDPPQVGHGTGQGQVLFGSDKHETFEEISIRGALHDQEADPTGYVLGSQLEMLHFRGRHRNDSGKIHLEQATLVNVFCLTPRDPWVHPPSWRVWLGADVARDLNQDPRDSLNYGVKGGSGLTYFLPGQKKSFWYLMWRGEAMAGETFDQGYRLGGGGQSGLSFTLLPQCRLHLAADVLRFPVGNVGNVVRYYGAVSYSLAKDFEFRIISERQNGYSEVRGGATFYW